MEKDILTKSEKIINLLFYGFRYILYWLGFSVIDSFIPDSVGEGFGFLGGLSILIFGILSVLHGENKEKIQRAIISKELREYDEVMKKSYRRNQNTNQNNEENKTQTEM